MSYLNFLTYQKARLRKFDKLELTLSLLGIAWGANAKRLKTPQGEPNKKLN